MHRPLLAAVFSVSLALTFIARAGATQPGPAGQANGSSSMPEWCRSLPRPEYKALKRRPSPDPWFEIYQVSPDVFAIYEPHQAEEVISYFILGRRRGLLFDTGLGIGNMAKVVHTLTPLPITVLNSHTHDDHVGGNWQFPDVRSRNTGFSRADARGSVEDAQAELGSDQLCDALPHGFDRSTFRTRPWHIAGWVHDGSTFDLGGRTLQVITTPGHTPDGICLFDREHGLLFTGDVYYPGQIYLYRPETDLNTYQHSIERLIALLPEVKLLLPSHNVAVAEPKVLRPFLQAFERVRSGEIQPAADGRSFLYTTDGFTFRMQRVASRH